jgi:hypothetical protein
VSKPVKVLQTVFLLLVSTGGVAFAILAVLAATGLADPRLGAAAFGVTLLAAGADEIAGALVTDWVRRPWKLSPGRRLSAIGAGLVLGSAGEQMIALDRVPLPARLAAVAVFVVGFVLILAGQVYERRRAEAARGGPGAEPDAAGVQCTGG